MKYCSECGSALTSRVPKGDHLLRDVCDTCGMVHYQNPKVVTGCILEWQSRVLLCRRAIEPRSGYWTLPAGFMENNETVIGAAFRETREEANAEVEDSHLFAMFNLPHISQVYVMFRGRLKQGRMEAGLETLEVGLFDEKDVPWNRLAFPVVQESLALYFADRRKGTFGVHMADVIRRPDRSVEVFRY